MTENDTVLQRGGKLNGDFNHGSGSKVVDLKPQW